MSSKPFPFQISPTTDDEKFMLEALKMAWKAFLDEEVPVGAVLVLNGRIIGKGHNQVETLVDATAHAEMLCLTAGFSAAENWRLNGATLYSTLEPCSMCAGAMFLSRIDRVVYGAKDLRHGANGSFVDLFAKPHPIHPVKVESGVLAEPASFLMKEFFRLRREGDGPGASTD